MNDILAAIDEQIAHLQQVRALLSESSPSQATKPGRGRPKGSTKKPEVNNAPKREMSAEGRARIAAAQKKRWAALKKAR